jgi:hypothetical protein
MFKKREYLESIGEIPNMHEGIKPIENQLYLIPPCIQSKFVSSQESPANIQGGGLQSTTEGTIPLKIRCITWNNARTPQKP